MTDDRVMIDDRERKIDEYHAIYSALIDLGSFCLANPEIGAYEAVSDFKKVINERYRDAITYRDSLLAQSRT